MHPLVRRIEVDWPRHYWAETRILVACSGGPDSMALAAAFHELQPEPRRLEVAHFHHGLRGQAADRDAEFVRDWCERHQRTFHLGHADPLEMTRLLAGEGPESAARQLRYRYLTDLAHQRGARYLLTGHTADDQAETVLHHILRGTGLNGLAGIRPTRPASPALTVARPLLNLNRQDILSYLEHLQITACQDEHNQSDRFFRSRLRNELLPMLEQEYRGSARVSLLKLARQAREAQEALAHVARELLEKCEIREAPCQVTLGCEPLRNVPIHLKRELFVQIWVRQGWPQQDMSLEHWQKLAEMAGETPACYDAVLPGRFHATRREYLLQIREPAARQS